MLVICVAVDRIVTSQRCVTRQVTHSGTHSIYIFSMTLAKDTPYFLVTIIVGIKLLSILQFFRVLYNSNRLFLIIGGFFTEQFL